MSLATESSRCAAPAVSPQRKFKVMATPTRLLLTFGTVLSVATVVPLHVGDSYSIPVPTLVDVNGLPVTPTNAFTFTSNNSAIASVDSNGLVTASAIGNAQISVSYGGLTAQVTIAVLQPSAATDQIAQPLVSTYPSKFFLAPPPVAALGVIAPSFLGQ
jgi:hypothetical protein